MASEDRNCNSKGWLARSNNSITNIECRLTSPTTASCVWWLLARSVIVLYQQHKQYCWKLTVSWVGLFVYVVADSTVARSVCCELFVSLRTLFICHTVARYRCQVGNRLTASQPFNTTQSSYFLSITFFYLCIVPIFIENSTFKM